MKTDYIGIDYSLGKSNYNPETGIHYGIIPAHAVPAWYEESEAQYGEATCPKCGEPAKDFDTETKQLENGVAISTIIPDEMDNWERYTEHGCDDYYCETCELIFDSQFAFPDEPQSFTYEQQGYSATQSGDDSDIFILESPYFSRCQYCSPCAPGAGYILNEVTDGIKTYCLGHDWFENEKAPYTVYDVKTGKKVNPKKG